MSQIDRITSQWFLVAPVVDLQPAFNLLVVARANEDVFPPEVRAFAAYKVEEAIREMRKAAKYLDEQLKAQRVNTAPPKGG